MSLTRPEKIARSFELGRLEWKLDSNQEGMHEHLLKTWDLARIHVWNCSRQIGKSWLALLIGVMLALKKPRSQIKYAAETQKQVRAILRPHMRDILADCPPHLRPTFHGADGEYRFHNGSLITISGCETEERANRLLGQHADLFIVDEAGSIDILDYVVRTIALPQTMNTGGRILLVSTPAKTPDHSFKEHCDAAEAKGVLIQRTVYDNPRLTPAIIAEYMAESGGEESTEWQREYLVRHVTDIDRSIIRSATAWGVDQRTLKVKDALDRSYRPKWFDPYVFVDIGWAPDFTGILWAYWDYERAKLVIEREWMLKHMDTKTLATVIVSNEMELWGRSAYRRVGDIEGRTQADLVNDHGGLMIEQTPKDDLDAQINNLNLMVAGKKYGIEFHPEVRMLKRQLVSGVWNKNRTKFGHSRVHGHYDLLAALIYGGRNVDYTRIPDGYGSVLYGPNTLVITDTDANEGHLSKLRSFFGLD